MPDCPSSTPGKFARGRRNCCNAPRLTLPESTWFHIHAQTGQLLERLTFRNRVQRWLYNGLHTLDFSVLIYRRPLWDILLILLCGAAAIFSLTSITIAWRRLRTNP